MEDLCVNLSLLENNFRDLAVLAWRALHQIDYIVDSTCFQSVLLLLISTIHDGCRQIIGCLPLHNEVQNVVCEKGLLLLAFPSSFFALVLLVILACPDLMVDSEHPKEVTQWK